jgi:hypothetical protein
MASVQGRAQSKTGASDPAKALRAQAVLPPGDPVRVAYDALVHTMGISGAEVLRTAIVSLYEQRTGKRAALREAG